MEIFLSGGFFANNKCSCYMQTFEIFTTACTVNSKLHYFQNTIYDVI